MQIQRKEGFLIGVDVGATKIAAALVTADGEVLAADQVLTEPNQGSEAVLGRIADQINRLARQAPAQILGIGIGTPGQVDALDGVVRNAVNMGWEEVHLVQEVRTRLDRDWPVWVQKDANASALGEYVFGAARDCPDFVYLGIGSGLGGGVVANGSLVTGAAWNAAELGHLVLDPDGLPCNCGLRGCAETIVSGPGLLNLVLRQLQSGTHATGLVEADQVDTALILEAAQQGDPLCLAALSEVGRHLGLIMAACVALLNPAVIVIGGGMGLAGLPWFLPAARYELERRTLPASHQSVQIRPSRLTSSAVGAASLVWYYRSKGG